MLRRSLPLALVLALASACGGGDGAGPAQAAGGGGLVLRPEDPADPRPYFHDFGRVEDGLAVRHVFRLENTDPRPVAIKKVTPGCGCTVPALRSVAPDGALTPGRLASSRAEELLVVPPGHFAEIELKIDTGELATKNADKLITIAVTTDSPNGYYLNLELHLYVEKALVVVPPAIELGSIPASAGGSKSVDIVRAPGATQRVKEIASVTPGVHAELVEEERFGVPVWVLRAGFEPPLALGPQRAEVVLATESAEGEPGKPLTVKLSAQAVEDLTSDPERLVFAAPRGEAFEARAVLSSLLSGHRLRVLGLDLPPEHRELLRAAAEPLDLDDEGKSERWSIVLTTEPPLAQQAMLTGTLAIRLDDPQHPRFELPYVVHLRD